MSLFKNYSSDISMLCIVKMSIYMEDMVLVTGSPLFWEIRTFPMSPKIITRCTELWPGNGDALN
uniref:Uncharacterized protein n=1 Tax=Rhizophora mucronata TaxID=61149 RepID=A0A2P2J4E5_RHIMU